MHSRQGQGLHDPLQRPPRDADGASYHDADYNYGELDGAKAEYLERVASLLVDTDATAARALALAADSAAHWDAFHSRHAGSFFRPRQYITRAFPCLLTARSVYEMGCGNGSNVWPLLDLTRARVYASDTSPAAIALLRRHPRYAAVAAEGGADARLVAFVAGGAATPLSSVAAAHFSPVTDDIGATPTLPPVGTCDAVLLTFVASAVLPSARGALFAAAAAALAPGGALCFRDYAVGDLAELRAPPQCVLAPHLHARADGTLAGYVTPEEVTAELEAAGLRVAEARVACVLNGNRATGAVMRRAWVHALAHKA